MKKKGLILATIVMVVVLVASLTTATYAWFTTTSSTSVESITISAASGAEVKIGILSAQLSRNADATQDSFISGDVTVSSTGATGGEPALGSNLNTGLQLDTISKATGMGSLPTYTADQSVTNEEGHYYVQNGRYLECPKDGDAPTTTYTKTANGSIEKLVPSTLSTNAIVKAAGETTKNQQGTITGTTATAATIEAAVANEDYLHFTLGLAASVENINQIKLVLFVNPTDSKSTIGITSALHFDYKVDGGSWVDGASGDVYSTNNFRATKTSIHAASTVGAQLSTEDTTVLNAGWEKVEITISPASSTFVVNTEIHQVEFYIYYDGADSDCIKEALGSSCQVMFFVTNTKAN